MGPLETIRSPAFMRKLVTRSRVTLTKYELPHECGTTNSFHKASFSEPVR